MNVTKEIGRDLNFFLFVVKEPTHNMIMMSTYSGIVVRDDQKEEYRYSK